MQFYWIFVQKQYLATTKNIRFQFSILLKDTTDKYIHINRALEALEGTVVFGF